MVVDTDRTMHIPYYQVDAFTSQTFAGNPAGVCVLENWLPDNILQCIATENNLAETAFFTREDDHYHLRWFTPILEVDLCGHATLATAFVLYSELGCPDQPLRFHTRSGWLAAVRHGNIIELDFPARPPVPCPAPEELLRGLGSNPREVLKARDFVAVYDSQAQVAALTPDMALLAQLDCLGVVATARGEDADFVSRFFAPRGCSGRPRDRLVAFVTHTVLGWTTGQNGFARETDFKTRRRVALSSRGRARCHRRACCRLLPREA